MTSDEATVAVIDALETLQIPYMVVGSLSSSYYGIGRLTKDADFVIQLGSESVTRIADLLGKQFHLDPQMSFETVTMTTRHAITVAGLHFGIELFHLSDDPHDQERFRRRRRAKLGDREASLPTAEDVIITKLRWVLRIQRGKDWEDIRNIIAVRGDQLDWDYIYSWADRHGDRAILEEIRQSLSSL